MNLLLEIDDILVCVVIVGVFTECTWIFLFLFLASELHSNITVIAGAIAK